MIIASISVKGGAGKTTSVVNIAASFAKMGKKVLLVDGDDHSKSARRWCARRDKLKDVSKIDWLTCTPGKVMRDKVKGLAEPYDITIIDLHGADTADNRYMMSIADAIVIPFKPSQGEVDTYLDLKKLLDEMREYRPHTKYITFLTEASTLTARDKKEAREFLESKGLPLLDTVLHNRQAFKDCLGLGLGVIEMNNAKAAAEFNELFFEIIRGLGNDEKLKLDQINLQ